MGEVHEDRGLERIGSSVISMLEMEAASSGGVGWGRAGDGTWRGKATRHGQPYLA